MADKIEQQIEKILDETPGDRHSVIVRMASPDDPTDSLLRLAASAIQDRNMTLTARDVLPKSRGDANPNPAKQSGQVSVRTFVSVESLATKVAASPDVHSLAMEILKTAGLELLKPLLSSYIVQNASKDAARLYNIRVTRIVQPFWTSTSALLDLSTTDLRELPKAIPQVQDIYPNRILSVPRLVEARNLPTNVTENQASAWGLSRIGALATWGAYGARGKGVRVGLLDTGVDNKHPDLKDKVVAWAEFDSQGRKVSRSKPHDTHKHGTHCAGIIAGGNSSGQWIGVAPEAELAVALVLDGEKGGTDAQVLAGIDWLVEQKVNVISMSLGGLTLDLEMPSTYTKSILTCLTAGIPVVTAIGNEGSETTGSPGNDLFAFSVGATDYMDRAAGFSGGRTHIVRKSSFIPPEYLPLTYSKPDVSAPGVAINSSIPGGTWEYFNGTSMATPHVAGAIALLLSATCIMETVEPAERAFLIQDLITGSVEELGESGQDHRFGFGRIEVLRAISYAIERGYARKA